MSTSFTGVLNVTAKPAATIQTGALISRCSANRLRALSPANSFPGFGAFLCLMLPVKICPSSRLPVAERLPLLASMQEDADVLLATAIRLKDDLAAGRFCGADSRFAANVLGAWLQIVKDETFAGDPPDEDIVDRIERLYTDIQNRLSAH